MTTWHVITGEFPPQGGGVSDYTRQLARGLAEAGDQVEIWAPPCVGPDEAPSDETGVRVHRLPDQVRTPIAEPHGACAQSIAGAAPDSGSVRAAVIRLARRQPAILPSGCDCGETIRSG